MKVNDPKIKAKFLNKCHGLHWLDPDNNNELFVASDDDIHFRSTRGNKSYEVIGLRESYDPETPRNDDCELWSINHQLFGCIYEHYHYNNDPRICVLTKRESFLPDGKWDFSDSGAAAADEPPKKRAAVANEKKSGGKRRRN